MTNSPPELWARLVDSEEALHGVHEGHRAVHAKGVLCSGTFRATPRAATLCRAPHLQGDEIRVHVRFSNAGGDPTRRDATNDGRGMAVKFYLQDGTTTDISAITIPVFVARSPEDVLELNLARQADPATGRPDLNKIGAYLEKHPEAVPAVEAAMVAQAPESYLRCRYFALHAFKLVSSDGAGTWVRYRWDPDAGEAWLDRDEAKQRDHDYLRVDLEERLAPGPQGFALWAEVAEEGDPLDDPTARWPEEREQVELGHLAIAELAFDRDRDGDILVFDPTRVPDGIELSNDPILLARPHAYDESVYRRSGVRREA